MSNLIAKEVEFYNSPWGEFQVDEQSEEFQALVKRVRDGQSIIEYEEECPCCGQIMSWKRTHLTDDAKEAMDELEVMCEQLYKGTL